jgi:diaminopimelate decarboxylase
VVVDCLEEIDRLGRLARQTGRVQDVYLRVTPGVSAHTHEHIATGGDDVKFGFPISGGFAEHAVLAVHRTAGLRLTGIHSHIGSQILDTAGLRAAAARIAGFVRLMTERHSITVDEIDLGGGAGIPYLPGQRRLEPNEFVEALRRGLRGTRTRPRAARGRAGPIHDRHGRGDAVPGRRGQGRHPASVRISRRRDERRTAALALRRAVHSLDRQLTGAPRPTVVCGKHCESGDIAVPDLALPNDIRVGDLLAARRPGPTTTRWPATTICSRARLWSPSPTAEHG